MEQEIRELKEEDSNSQSNQQDENNQIVVAFTISTERVINVAVYNRNKRGLYVVQFNDNEHYSNFEGLLLQLNPKDDETDFKVYYDRPELETESGKLDRIMEGIEQKKFTGVFSKKKGNEKQALKFLLEGQLSNYVMVMSNSANMFVLGKLITQLKLDSDETNQKKMKLEVINLSQYMKLDQAAIIALQILPKSQQKRIISSNQTLFDLICKCKTSIGVRCLKRWMKQPLQDQIQIKKRQDYLEYFMKNPDMRNYIQNSLLNSVGDLDKLYFTFYKVASDKTTKTTMNDLIKILKVVKALESFIDKLQKKGMNQFERHNLYDLLCDNVQILQKPVMMIEKNVIMQGKESEFHIKPSTQQALNKIMKEKQKVLDQIKQQLSDVKKLLKVDVDLVETENATQKYIFEGMKQKVQEAIKNNKEFKQGTIRGKKMTFKNNTLGKLCGDLNELDLEYKEEQQTIIRKMFKTIATYYQVLQNVSEVLSTFDIYTSWAHMLSSESLVSWSKPEFGKELIARDMRHPCVNNCVANTLEFTGNNRTAIITGPNMGGKSTYIRMVGICIYLAHIGFYVPARIFQTPIIDAIITRVGASDIQLQGVSTFMNQMIETVCAIRTATQKSIVLIDELGRGTSTHQGFGIAWAICNYFHSQIRSYCLFATHFHQLTRMADQVEGVTNLNASCTVSQGNIIMNYKIIPGKAKMSYGIQLAKSMKFPQRVIKYSQVFYSKLQSFQNKKQNNVEQQKSSILQIPYEFKLKILDATQKMRQNGNTKEEISEYVKIQMKNLKV